MYAKVPFAYTESGVYKLTVLTSLSMPSRLSLWCTQMSDTENTLPTGHGHFG